MIKPRYTRRKHQFKGIPVVPGVAMGRVHLKFRDTTVLSDRRIEAADVPRELELLQEALRQAKTELLTDREQVAKKFCELEATIFDTHLAILDDKSLIGKIQHQISQDKKPVEVVVSVIVEGYYQALAMVHDEHIRERAADIRDVGRRLLASIRDLKLAASGKKKSTDRVAISAEPGDIIFARELLPSDVTGLERAGIGGVVSEMGNARNHSAVLLRANGIPTVMGVEGLAGVLRDGDFVIVDGSSGQVFVNPKETIVKDYRGLLEHYEQYRDLLQTEVALPARTTDSESLRIGANISKPSDVDLIHMYNLDDVGLYRTEFDLIGRTSFPSEDDLYGIYRDAVERANDKVITIRTMDIVADKALPYVRLPDEENPAMGRRSFRLALDLEDYQMRQLRAMLRASAHGPMRILFPFITSIEDLRTASRMVRQAQRQLKDRKQAFASEVPIGMMVEVPAAAFAIEKFAREADFFSIGTNDLVQYVCAADRNQAEVQAWYKGYNPGVLALLKHIADAAGEHGVPFTVCGEMAGDPFYTMFLIGIGCRDLSMSPAQVPLVKKIIRSVNTRGAEGLARRALQYSAASQIRHLFQDTVEQILGQDLRPWVRDSGS
jgi:phosphoenolpyruvate-protein phosphotransferase